MARQGSSQSAGQLFPLADQLSSLVLSYLALSTLKFYNATLNQFYAFLMNLHPNYNPFPLTSVHVGLYIVNLYNSGLAGSTITSRLSALSFAYQLYKKPNPVDDFMVTRALKSVRKLRSQHDTHLPLSPVTLHEIIANVHHLGFSYYLQIVFKSMLSLAFAAFLQEK